MCFSLNVPPQGLWMIDHSFHLCRKVNGWKKRDCVGEGEGGGDQSILTAKRGWGLAFPMIYDDKKKVGERQVMHKIRMR